MKRYSLLIIFSFTFGSALAAPPAPLLNDTGKITLLQLIENLKYTAAVATGDGAVKDGVDREKALRDGLFSAARSSLKTLEQDIARPEDKYDKIIYELAQACSYALLSICYEKGYIPENSPYNFGRDVAIYKPLTEHTLAYYAAYHGSLEMAYRNANLSSVMNGLETYAQVMNKMLHREMMNAWYRSGGLGDIGVEVKENIWKYYRTIYLPMFRVQDYVMNKGPLTTLFGGYKWDMEEFNSMPRWISLLGEQATGDDLQLLSDTYLTKIRMHYHWNSYYYSSGQQDECFGKKQEWLTGFYKTWSVINEKETDRLLKKKLKKNQYNWLSVMPAIVMDNYRDNVEMQDETGFKNEVSRLLEKYLPDFTDQAFSALKIQEDPNYSLEFFWKYNLRQVDFIFNKLKVKAPELEARFVAGLIDYMRTRAEIGLFATTKEYEGKMNELSGYFKNLLNYLKNYASRTNNGGLKDKLDEINAAMEKDPYTTAPPHFFQDAAVLDLVKKL